MAKFWKTALRLGLMTLAGLAVGINLYLWNARSLMGNAMPMPFGFGAAVVLSGSMEPALSVDDLILVAEEDAYETGDVVVYQSGSMLVVHRIESMDADMVTTKGDANDVADEPVNISAIKGRVIAHIDNCGPWVRAIKSPVGTITLLALAVLLPELSFQREKQKDGDELEKIKEEIRRLKAEQE